MDFKGKKGLVLGVANDRSIAAGIAKKLSELGAELAFNHLPDKGDAKKNERRIRKVADPLNTAFVHEMDVTDEASIDAFFAKVKSTWDEIDFVVHSIAFGNIDDIRKPTYQCSKAGFLQAMEISCYSLIQVSQRSVPLMSKGSSILTLSYYGGEKVVPGYNMMGICKSALEMTVRYIAYDLGPKDIRINAISAGPIKTLAASAVGDFGSMLKMYETQAPLLKNVTVDDVANSAAFLLSDHAKATTGEIMYVDSGYSIMGGPNRHSL